MAKSIMQAEKECYLCGSQSMLEEHHVFGGTANRKISEKHGLKVWLCHQCHNEPPNGVHHNAKHNHQLKAEAQKAAMLYYGWSENTFIKIFGKNYL
jgi:hypothetical protein